MVDYVVPTGVRIADADRVRLGAHLAEGTTVMHEGFVNFNAGTLGASMVEGRISAGVVVGDGSDVGGGASIMGTLSGGGKEVISVGERCLLGANAGIGISLGDDCVVEAGCYVTAGTKVTVHRHGRQAEGGQGARAVRRRATCCSAATRSPARSRRCRGRATASPSTPPCTPTEDSRDGRAASADWCDERSHGRGLVGARRGRASSPPWCRGVLRPGRARCSARRVHGDGRRPHRRRSTLEQAENAALIAAIAVGRGLPARAATIALATAYQESKLRNIEHGDRDSLGLFQQRPSQGWGTARADPRPGTTRPTRSTTRWRGRRLRGMEITEAAQVVQRSAFPEAYADHEADARVLASALTGNSPRAFSCRLDDEPEDEPRTD